MTDPRLSRTPRQALPDETRRPIVTRRARPRPGTFPRLLGHMERVGPPGKPVERLACRVDLVIMLSIGEGEEFVEPGGKPRGCSRYVHLTGFEPGRLSEEARLLVEPHRAQHHARLAGPTQVLNDRAAEFGVLDHGLVGTPLA